MDLNDCTYNNIGDKCFNYNETTNCSHYSIESLINDECITCKNSYYRVYKEYNNSKGYYKCVKSLKGYYLDNQDSFFKLCYNTCLTCDIKGNNYEHNCN